MQTAELVAGRELDVLVAEKVMGWEPYSGGYYYGIGGRLLACVGRVDGYMGEFDKRLEWHPSTDIAAAWQVVERLGGGHIEIIHWGDSDTWQVNIGGSNERKPYQMPQDDWAETAPLAICRAALAALGH